MKFVKRKLAVACVVVGLMVMMMTSSVFAASGTQYGYSNLKLSWITTSTSASATLKADRKSNMWVSVEGQVSDGKRIIGIFDEMEETHTSNIITARTSRKEGTIVNGSADAYRYDDSQGLTCPII